MKAVSPPASLDESRGHEVADTQRRPLIRRLDTKAGIASVLTTFT